MDLKKLITRSFFHYLRGNMLAGGGLAIATAVITGAFIIGDSLSHSLEQAVIMRLGNITHSVTAGDRLFTRELGDRFSAESGKEVSTVLVAEGMAVAEGGRERLNRIQVLGVDDKFGPVIGADLDYSSTGPGEVIVSENLAGRMQLEVGDFFQLRMKRAGVIPMNTPLVSDADQSVSRRVMVAAIAGDEEYGRFNLRVSQTAPYNVFVNIGWLNMVMGLDGLANALLISDPDVGAAELKGYVDRSWRPADANLIIENITGAGVLSVSSERVFIEEHVTSRLTGMFPGSRQFLTYFVNSLEKGDSSTPYSFVTAGHRFPLDPGETVINSWLADDLSAETGDTIRMSYWETGPRRELAEREVSLVVTGIIPIEEAVHDSVLMPQLPGLSDAGSCRDWEAGVPIVLDRIRVKDERYWDDYRGTPKAYISLEQGQEMWTNRFGNLTALWLPADITGHQEAEKLISSAVDPTATGFMINELREHGLKSAAAGVDFGMLFGGLGFFVMLAGVMLFFLLLLFNLEKRSGQVRLFSSMGYPLKLIRKIYLGEGMLVALAGTLAGLVLAVLYARLVHWALTGVWQDIVRTELLVLVVNPASLAAGFVVGMVLALVVTYFSLNRYILKKPVLVPGKQPVDNRYRVAAAIILTLGGIGVLARQMITGVYTDPLSFFIAGGLLIPAFLLAADLFLLKIRNTSHNDMSLWLLSMKNLTRNRTRSLSVIILLALGIFVVIATGSHRNDAAAGDTEPSGGTGGFLFVAEATVPVLYDLNAQETIIDLNIPSSAGFVQFMASYADDASCLNLNEVANPRILSVDPSLLSGRFSFAAGSNRLDRSDPWSSLEGSPDDTGNQAQQESTMPVIPAIADQAVIQWGLNKRVGDTLIYTNERGEEIGLLLTGGLANSIFQGNVIVSEENFLKHFPSVSGSSFFLIDAPRDQQEEISEELAFIFRDHGWEMTTAVDRLNEFNSVENTYLGIFLMLGALGILLGVAGLAVVMARSISERKSEIALYVSMGYKTRQIISLIFREYLVLLAAGLAAGLPPALITALPSLLPGNESVNLSFLLLLSVAIFINGLLWIAVTSRIMIRPTGIAASLKND